MLALLSPVRGSTGGFAARLQPDNGTKRRPQAQKLSFSLVKAALPARQPCSQVFRRMLHEHDGCRSEGTHGRSGAPFCFLQRPHQQCGSEFGRLLTKDSIDIICRGRHGAKNLLRHDSRKVCAVRLAAA